MNNPKVNVVVSGHRNDYHSTYKTYILRGGIPFADQVIMPDTKYVIKYDFDLGGGAFDIDFNNADTHTVAEVTYYYIPFIADGSKYTLIDDTLVFVDAEWNGLSAREIKPEKGTLFMIASITGGLHKNGYCINVVTVPENCILEFDGGSLSNGTIIGQDTYINDVGGLGVDTLFGEGITREGTWRMNEGGGSTPITVDSELSDDSENPVQNKVVKAALDNCQPIGDYPERTNLDIVAFSGYYEDLKHKPNLNEKADKDNVYNKSEVDSKIITVQSNTYSKDAINQKIADINENINTIGNSVDGAAFLDGNVVKNKDGNVINPITSDEQVLDENGRNLRTVLAKKADIEDVYTKQQTNAILSNTPETNVIVIDVPSGQDIVTYLITNVSQEDRNNNLFRVPGPNNGSYSEWGWDGITFVQLADKDFGFDSEPTLNSNNILRSGVVADKLGYLKDDDEFIYILTDKDSHVIFGIREDGSIEWYKGIPTPIKNILETFLTKEKAAEIYGCEQLNSEYVYCIIDNNQKLVFGINNNGDIISKTVNELKDKIEDIKQKVYAKSTDITVPSYLEEFVDKTVNDVREYTKGYGPCVVLPIITDTHYEYTTAYIKRYKENIACLKEIDKEVSFDGLIHLGDIPAMWGRTAANPDSVIYERLKEYINAYKENFDRFFLINGNHDGDSCDFFNNENWYAYTKFNRTYVKRNGNSPYYYVDFEDTKLRLIFMAIPSSIRDTRIVEGETWASYYNGKVIHTYWGAGEEQLNWLATEALNTEDDWSVILFSHCPINWGPNTQTSYVTGTIEDRDVIEGIFNAYHNHTIYTNGSINADFTRFTNTKMILSVAGHMHYDAIIQPGMTIDSLRINNFPCPVVLITREFGGAVNTKNQDIFDTLVYNKGNNTIRFIRFGNIGEDRVINLI